MEDSVIEQSGGLVGVSTDQVWIYFTLNRRNIFVNVYDVCEGKKVAVDFKALNQFNEKLGTKSKNNVDNFDLFIEYIGRWLQKWCIKTVVVVFRGFGGSDRLGTFYSGSDRLRTLILESLSTHDVGISVLIERSGEAYNGCKTRRWRRRRIDQRRSAL